MKTKSIFILIVVLSAIFFLFSCEQGITNDNTEYLNDLNGNLQFKSINTTDYEISGWYNDGWNTESHDIYMKYHNLFSIVNPYWYNLGTSTSSSIANGKIYERSYAFNNQEIIEIHNNGDLIIPAIGDVVQGQLNKILNSSRARKRLIDNLVNTAIVRNYDGWDLNFEKAHEKDKALFSAFVNQLGNTLQSKGKVLDVTIGAFNSTTSESYWIFDLDGLKTDAVRRIKIMAYDQHLGENPIPLDAVGDISWVRSVLNYVIHQRNVPSDKVILGIPNYGWSYTYNAVTSSWTIQFPFSTHTYYMSRPSFQTWWQDVYKENYAEWTDAGVSYAAFYNNAQSVQERLRLVTEFNLAGACFWVLGREDENIYTSAIPAELPGIR
ncbi:MAG: putative sporulation-specific glycosylase YdhD [Bacteroidetes bacterium ADurb.BinA174]|nr:MAG: putative sporulation-specific glycosylase YdhD [Bacteroidetes bacterium ADurb.BinA174]